LAHAALAEAEAQATRQEDRVLAFFHAHPAQRYTPVEVHRRVLPEAPLTSARRALTNLTTAGHLEKCAEQRPGLFGKPNCTWRLRPPAPPGTQLALFGRP